MHDSQQGGRPQYREGRAALLDAATRVIARKGFRGLTYRAVAEEAGVTHGLVTYHFGSRDRLIHETIAHVSSAAVERSGLPTPSGNLSDFASGLSGVVSESPDQQAVQFELAMEARRRPELLPEIRQQYEGYITIVGETLQRLGLPVDAPAARLVFAAFDGLALQQLIFDRPDETDEAVALLQRVLAVIAADPPGDVVTRPAADP